MKKLFVLFLLVNYIAISAIAQKKSHKVVFEITSPDTADYNIVLRQINNVIKDAPNTQIELVCHGPAIFMLVKNKTTLSDMMEQLQNKQQVKFAACANSMRKNNLTADLLVPVATVVPNGVMEIVAKQEDGWSYIKTGH